MPSDAYNVFRTSLLADVDALIDAHSALSTGARGRQSLAHLSQKKVKMSKYGL